MDFDNHDLIRPGDDFDSGFFPHIIFGNQRSRMLRLERVFDANADARLFKRFRGFRMNRFHADVRELISHVVIRESDWHGALNADDIRIRRRQMKFFMNNRFVGLHFHRDFAERHVRIAPVKLPHNAFRAFRIAGHDGQRFREIHLGQHRVNALVYHQIAGIVETAEVNARRVNAVILDDIRGIKGRMRLADRR